MIGAEFISFDSYSDLYGSQLPFDEFCESVARFSRNSVLWVCSYIGVSLQLWDGDGSDSPNLAFLLNQFFQQSLATNLLMRHRFHSDGKRILFHRRQLLFLSKIALKHCSDQGVNASLQTRSFGLLFLHANDHFHFDLIPTLISGVYSRDDFARLLAEMLAAEEYSQIQIPNIFVRSRKMCLDLPGRMTTHPDYLDIEVLFFREHKIELRLYQYLTFGVATRFGLNLAKSLQGDPRVLPIRARDFVNSDIEQKTVMHFLDLMSSTAAEMAQYSSVSRRDVGARSRWASDNTIFRQFPMVMQWYEVTSSSINSGHLMMDLQFLFQKVLAEPYFLGVSSKASKFSRFWGALFEQYVHDIFQVTTKSSLMRYIANPRLIGEANRELCDGVILVDEDTIVLLEYKSSIIRADRKYNGDHQALLQEVSEKFVYDSKDKNPKAVLQLVTAVKRIFEVGSSARAEWCDFSRLTRCYVLTITLDTIGGAFALSPLLNTFFQEALANTQLCSVEIRPFFCTDVETLEMLSGSFVKHSLSSILERWYQINNLLATPLAAIRMEDLLPARPAWLWDEWADFSEEATRAIFGSTPEAMEHLNTQMRLRDRLR